MGFSSNSNILSFMGAGLDLDTKGFNSMNLPSYSVKLQLIMSFFMGRCRQFIIGDRFTSSLTSFSSMEAPQIVKQELVNYLSKVCICMFHFVLI